MKTFNSRFLKAALALVLCLMMLASTTVTGFAAVVENSSVKANADVAVTGAAIEDLHNILYFDNSKTKWSDSYICLVVGKSNYSSVYQMTKVTNSPNMYYINADDGGWGDSTYIAVIGTSSKWGSGSWGYSNCKNATHYTNQYTGDISKGSAFGIVPQSSSNGCNLALAYFGGDPDHYDSALEGMKTDVTIKKKVAPYNSTTYSTDTSSIAKVTLEGRYASSTGTNSWSRAYVTAVTASTPTASTSSVKYDNVIWGTDIKLQYSNLNAGYDFVGWYDSSGTQLSTSANSYTFTNYAKGNNGKGGNTDYYAYFKQKSVKVTFNANGHGTAPTEQTIAYGGTASTPSAPSESGWTFGGWYENQECTGSAFDFTTALTADKTLYAKWTASTFDVTVIARDTSKGSTSPSGSTKIGSSPVSISATPKPGYKFTGWTTSNSNVSVANPSSATTTATATGTGTIWAEFAADTYSWTATAGANGSINKTSGSVNAGSSVTITATPNKGYKVGSVNASSGSTATFSGNTITFTPGANNASCTVNFVESYHTVTISDTSTSTKIYQKFNGGALEEITSSKQIRDTAELYVEVTRTNATPSNQYIQYVKLGDTTKISNVNGNISSTKISDSVTSDVTVTAKAVNKPYVKLFKPDASVVSYDITYYKDGVQTTTTNLRPSASGTATYIDYNTSASITAYSATGYYLTGLLGKSGSTAPTTEVVSSDISKDSIVYSTGNLTSGYSYKAVLTANPVITINETGTTGGTFKVDDNTFSSGGSVTYDSHQVIINAPANYKITNVTGGGTWSGIGGASASSTFNVHSNTTINVTYELAGNCTLSFLPTITTSGVIGATVTNTAQTNDFHKGGAITYSSTDSTIASVNPSTGLVTGLKPGTVTITAHCTDAGSTDGTYQYTVLAPSVTYKINSNPRNIGGTSSSTVTVANEPVSKGTTTYSSADTDIATVASNGLITAVKDGSVVITATYTVAGVGSYTATDTLTVRKPVVTLNLTSDTLNIGETSTASISVTNPPSISYTTEYASATPAVASVSGSTLTALKNGTSSITGKITVNGNTYSSTAKTLTVNEPSFAAPSNMTLAMSESGASFVDPTVTNPPANYGFTYAVKSGSSITISGKTITAVKPGATTVTRTFTAGSYTKSEDFTVTISDFSVAVSASTTSLAVNAGGTVTPEVPAYGTKRDISYAIDSASVANVLSVNANSGAYTAQKPGSAKVKMTVKYTYSDGTTTTKTATTNVITVAEPMVSIAPGSFTFNVGQSQGLTVTSGVTPASVDWTVDDDSIVSVDFDATSTTNTAAAISAGTATVTAIVYYNASYSKEVSATITVTDGITVSTDTVNLEYYPTAQGQKATDTVTVTLPATDITPGTVNVTSEDPAIATGQYNNGTVTVTAQGVGSTTLTVSYTPEGATNEMTADVTVNVTEYDPYNYVYVTDSNGWGSMLIHAWIDGGADKAHANMTKIGKNDSDQNVYAYRFLKSDMPDRVIFLQKDDWGPWEFQTDTLTLSTTASQQAFYLKTWETGKKVQTGTWTINLTKPNVSLSDASVPVGQDGSVTATTDVSASSYVWSVGSTATATISGTTATATVHGVATGETTYSVKAYAETKTAAGWLKSVVTDGTADDFVASNTATANLTVSGVQNTVNITTNYRDDIRHEYHPGINGGFVSINDVPIEEQYSELYDYGTTLALTATPASENGFIFEGWYSNNRLVDVSATKNITVTDDVNIEARFIQTAALTLTPKTGVTYEVYNTTGSQHIAITDLRHIPAGTDVTVTADLADGFTFIRWSEHTGSATSIDPNDPTVRFTMEVATTLTPDVVARFQMEAYEVVVDPIASATTVGTLTINSQEPPVDVELGQSANFSYALSNTTDYTFIGWYEGTDSTHLNHLVSKNPNYSVNPTKDMTLYAVVARNYYVLGISGDWSEAGAKLMTYEPTDGTYQYKNASITEFKIAPVKDSANNSTWREENGTDHVNFYETGHTGLVSFGYAGDYYTNNNAKVGAYLENYGGPVTLYWRPVGNSKYDLTASATEVGGSVYLSNGRPIADNLTSNSRFVDLAYDTYTVTSAAGDGETAETGVAFNSSKIESVSVETTLGGSNAANYKVSAFVVYDKVSKSVSAVTDISNMGNNKYAASISLSSSSYITPVIEAVDADKYIYVDAAAIKNETAWGPFVAAYTYDEDTTKYNGAWPGQLMIPSADGLSWYAKVPAECTAAVFDNYMYNSIPLACKDSLGLNQEILQTYDYTEMSKLIENDMSVITFVLKNNKDGYHGAYPDANNVDSRKEVRVNQDINVAGFGFDYLYMRNGTTPMTLTLKEAPATPAETLYVVSAGDVVHEDPYVGKWAVDWYIYDSAGRFLTNVVSNSLYNGEGDSNVLVQALHSKNAKYTAAYLDTCAVKISYEKANKSSNTAEGYGHNVVAYDGQWYGNKDNETMDIKVEVALHSNGAYVEEGDNIADYGKAFIIDGELTTAQKNVPFSDNKVNLTASILGENRFIGWYTKDEDGNFNKVNEAYDYTASVTNDKTFYAVFEECGENDLTITNQIYSNNVDTEILSHNGLALMSVAIYKSDSTGAKGDLITKSENSKQLASAYTSVETDSFYYIEVEATPLNQGAFYAFYTDATDKDGRQTYEEILTDEDIVDSTEKVTKGFVFHAYAGCKKQINIYTDVTKVENKAMLVYKYKSRFGDIKTYTVKDVELSDDECLGFEGNNNKPYTPSFLTRYIMTKKDGSEETTVYGTKLYETMLQAGYIVKAGTQPYNKVQSHSPTYNAANVWNQLLTWDVQSTDSVTIGKSIITVNAIQNDEEFTVTYSINGGSTKKEVSGIFNDVCVLEDTPEEIDGAPFRYWEEVIDEEGNTRVISTSRIFGMRYNKDITINAVYSVEEEDTFTPMIDTVTVTREYSDTSDTLYSDYLLHFANTKLGKRLSVGAQTTYGGEDVTVVDYGLIALTDRTYDDDDTIDRTDDTNIIYPSDTNSAYIATDMDEIKTRGKNYQAKREIDGKEHTFNYYYYSVTGRSLTNFNRCDYVLSYNNQHKTYTYKNWTFSGYAFIKYQGASGNIYFDYSDAADVELFTKGNASPEDIIGN